MANLSNSAWGVVTKIEVVLLLIKLLLIYSSISRAVILVNFYFERNSLIYFFNILKRV